MTSEGGIFSLLWAETFVKLLNSVEAFKRNKKAVGQRYVERANKGGWKARLRKLRPIIPPIPIVQMVIPRYLQDLQKPDTLKLLYKKDVVRASEFKSNLTVRR